MSFTSGMTTSSNSLNLDVEEIAAILRQVQSGQLSLQQHGQRPSHEEDTGLSLVHGSDPNVNPNFSEFSQPLRRPGRSLQDQDRGDDSSLLSKGALQKQIFAARMLGTPATVANKIAEQSGISSSASIKPNLGLSRPGGSMGMRSQEDVGDFRSGIAGSGSSPLMGSQNLQQQSGSDAKHTVPGLFSTQQISTNQQGPHLSGNSFGTQWITNAASTPQGGNTSFRGSTSADQSGQSVMGVVTPRLKASGPLGFSQDIDLRHQDIDQRSSPITQPPSSTRRVTSVSPGQLNIVVSPTYQAPIVGQATTQNISGGKTSARSTGGFTQDGSGLMVQSNTGGINPWEERGGGDEARKRKLQDELTDFEMQVGPSKQRKAGLDQNESRQLVGGPLQQSGWSASGTSSRATGGEEEPEPPYQWSTNYVHKDDMEEEEEEVDVEGWIDSLVTYKKVEEVDPDMLTKKGGSSERSDRKGSSRREKRRRSSSPLHSRKEQGGRRGSSRERNRRGASAGRDRTRSPLANRHGSPARRRLDVTSRRSPSPRYLQSEERRYRDRLQRDRERRSPRHERHEKSPRRERAERSPRHDRVERSPKRERAQRSPRRERAERSPRRDRAERSPRRDRADKSPKRDRTERSPRRDRTERSPRREREERSPRAERTPRRERSDRPEEPNRKGTGRGDSRDGPKHGSSQGKVVSHSRSSTGKDEEKQRASSDGRKKTSTSEHHKVDDSLKQDSRKSSEDSRQTGSKPKDGKHQPVKQSRSPPRIVKPTEEKKKIQINLEYRKGKDKPNILPDQSQSKQKADSTKTSGVLSTSQPSKDKTQSNSKEIVKEENLTLDEMTKIVGHDSIKHQISLFTKLEMSEHIENKELVEWFCYLCQMSCTTVKNYLCHVVGKKHKSNIVKAFTSAGKPLFVKYLQTLPRKPKAKKSAQTSSTPQSTTTKEGKSAPKSSPKGFQKYTGSPKDHLSSAEHKKSTAKKQDEDDDVVEISTTDNEEGRTPAGLDLIIPVYGYFCRACTKFYNTIKVTREEHSVDPDHIQNVKDYYKKVKRATDGLQPVQSLDDDEEKEEEIPVKVKPVDKKQVKVDPKKLSGEEKNKDKAAVKQKEVQKVDVKVPKSVSKEPDKKKDVGGVSNDAKEKGAKLKAVQDNSKTVKEREVEKDNVKVQKSVSKDLKEPDKKKDKDKVSSEAKENVAKVKAVQEDSKTRKGEGNVNKPKDLPSEGKSVTQLESIASTSSSAVKSNDILEVLEEVPEADDGKCARSRFYLRKTKVIIPEGTQNAPEGVKSYSDNAEKSKESTSKKLVEKKEPEVSGKEQNMQVKEEKQVNGSKRGKDDDKTNEKAIPDKDDSSIKKLKLDSSAEKQHTLPQNVAATKSGTKSTAKESRSVPSNQKGGEKSNQIDNVQESASKGQTKSSRNSSRSKSETSKDATKDDKSSANKEKNSSESKDEAKKKDSANTPSKTDKEKDKDTPSRQTRSTRQSERKNRQENENSRGSSQVKDSASKNNRDGTDRKKTPQKSSLRSAKRDDSSKSRAPSSRRSISSSERPRRSSRRGQSDRRKESNFPNMDDMVAIDEVGSSGDEQDADEVGEVDDKAVEKMMDSMGMDWQVVSEVEEEDASHASK